MSEEKQEIKGGCHCGKIKYTFRIPVPSAGKGQLTATRCNCTFCTKFSTTNLMLPDPDKADFTLLTESTAPRSSLGNYQPRVKSLSRFFCQDCGAHVWMEGYFEHEGMKFDVFAVNLASVDQPQDGIDLKDVKIKYFGELEAKGKGMETRDEPWEHGLL
ncbi:uncharacterized protein MYCFIDRAFT_81662 [Pseudocercospora fijiensis CIRAD86]|uniref:CENP-V/GFA domain-containing protein n=1 Tax=Pseudocercospora fijiensis (strain CIRAD86) TaxID=383855 RepID=M2ZWW0_PSEFD|nr:uncharacterized protein MYCFIDRAFT_81662 [Pseudocercospora fijiensis CIRAD86]EME83484.1 hypothetical protein MYCFIDRAFT_81662 [Pseudocercospora fijiensis CIRAD86]